jgi:hypothetical protein
MHGRTIDLHLFLMHDLCGLQQIRDAPNERLVLADAYQTNETMFPQAQRLRGFRRA